MRHQISQTQILLSKSGSVRFLRCLTPIQKPLLSQHLNFNFFLQDSKNKFVLWGRDDQFDRFLEQKIREKLAVLAGGIPANFIRLFTARGDVGNLVNWKRPSDGVMCEPGLQIGLVDNRVNWVCTRHPMEMIMSTSRESDLDLQLRGLERNRGLERGYVHSLPTVRVSYRIQKRAQMTAPWTSQACWEN